MEITAMHGVLNYRMLASLPADATPFVVSKKRLCEIIYKVDLDDVPQWLAEIISYLDEFRLNFPIVTLSNNDKI